MTDEMLHRLLVSVAEPETPEERDKAWARITSEVARLRDALDGVAHHILGLWANGAEEADAVTTLNAVARILEPVVRRDAARGAK